MGIKSNNHAKPAHTLTIVADLGDEKSAFLPDTSLFSIGFDFESDVEGMDFHVRSFDLLTGIKKMFRGKEIDLIVPMPKESYDFAEKLLWLKAKEDSDFLELLQHPEFAECGHDMYN